MVSDYGFPYRHKCLEYILKNNRIRESGLVDPLNGMQLNEDK